MMKRGLVLLSLIWAVSASASTVPQTTPQVIDPSRIFITSYFDCPVYWGTRQIANLRKGTRAQMLRSTKSWILVRFWYDGKYVTGWIRR